MSILPVQLSIYSEPRLVLVSVIPKTIRSEVKCALKSIFLLLAQALALTAISCYDILKCFVATDTKFVDTGRQEL